MTTKNQIEALITLKRLSEIATEDELGRALIVALDELVEGDDGVNDLDGQTILNTLSENEWATIYFQNQK
jgi:hypothetical protein